MSVDPHRKPRWPKAYSFTLITAVLFLGSWVLQLVFQVAEVSNEAAAHGETFSWADFWPQFFSATFENWQSEFLQLMWQAAGLAAFYHWGSSQSKESDDRLESKVDEVLRRLPERRVLRLEDTDDLGK